MFTSICTDQCITNGGKQPGKACIFPWKYDNTPEVYHGCANPPTAKSIKPWCPTVVTDGIYVSGSGNWGFCNMTNPECSNGKMGSVQKNMKRNLFMKAIYFSCSFMHEVEFYV